MSIRQRLLYACLFAAAASIAISQNVTADEYVWARSQWVMGPNRPLSVMGNGYGGYYVPRNGYGNNYEGQRFTNPTGYVIPANPGYTTQQTQPVQRMHRMRRR